MAFLPTVVRIKRHIDADTSENIIISTKRKRLSDDEPETSDEDMRGTIFKKLTTLKEGDSLEVEIKKALENEVKHSWELKENYKKGFTNSAKDLVSKKSKTDVSALRFKLVCSKRNITEDTPSARTDATDPNFHIFDAQKELDLSVALPSSSSKNTQLDVISCNGVPMESGKVEYVYDLYYTSLPSELHTWIGNICEIQKCNYLEYPDKDKDSSEEEEDDDENSESNWRNDYPDEEDTNYFEDEDDYLCNQMGKARLSESDDSFDTNQYDDSGDFDEDGKLLLYGQSSTSKTVFKKSTTKEDDSD